MDMFPFIETIRQADPADYGPYFVLADYLEDHGACDRAELIRVQCELEQRLKRKEYCLCGGDDCPAGKARCALCRLKRRALSVVSNSPWIRRTLELDLGSHGLAPIRCSFERRLWLGKWAISASMYLGVDSRTSFCLDRGLISWVGFSSSKAWLERGQPVIEENCVLDVDECDLQPDNPSPGVFSWYTARSRPHSGGSVPDELFQLLRDLCVLPSQDDSISYDDYELAIAHIKCALIEYHLANIRRQHV